MLRGRPIMHTLFDVGKLRVRQGLPRNIIKLLENGQPIEQLF